MIDIIINIVEKYYIVFLIVIAIGTHLLAYIQGRVDQCNTFIKFLNKSKDLKGVELEKQVDADMKRLFKK